MIEIDSDCWECSKTLFSKYKIYQKGNPLYEANRSGVVPESLEKCKTLQSSYVLQCGHCGFCFTFLYRKKVNHSHLKRLGDFIDRYKEAWKRTKFLSTLVADYLGTNFKTPVFDIPAFQNHSYFYLGWFEFDNNGKTADFLIRTDSFSLEICLYFDSIKVDTFKDWEDDKPDVWFKYFKHKVVEGLRRVDIESYKRDLKYV